MSNDEEKELYDKEKPKKMKFVQKVRQTFKRKPNEDKPASKLLLTQEPSTSGISKEQWKYDPTTKQLYSNGVPWGPGAQRYPLPEERRKTSSDSRGTAAPLGEIVVEEKPIRLGSISISWEKYAINDDRPVPSNTIEDLLSRRCRCPASFDDISASAVASKFWTILHILRGNYPPFLPGMSLRQMMVFRKVMQATDALDLPLQKVPPMGFQRFVEKMWTNDRLIKDCENWLGTPEDVLPDDLEKMDDLIMEREERVFILGDSVTEVLKSWMNDFEEKLFFSNGLFDDLEVAPNSLLTGFALEPSEDFMTIMQPVSLSADFISILNINHEFLDSIMKKTGIRSRHRRTNSYRIKVGLKQSEISKLMNLFWGESSAEDDTENSDIQLMNWVSNDQHLQWLADSIKRKPRRIIGLYTRYEKQKHEAEQQKRERKEVEAIIRNSEAKGHMRWEDNQQQSTGTALGLDSFFTDETDIGSPQCSSFDAAGPFTELNTELKFDDTGNKGMPNTFDDPIPMDPFTSWTDVSQPLPPPPNLAFRPPSRATIYSTDSELSMTFCRMSVDKMSLHMSDSEWADIDRLAQP